MPGIHDVTRSDDDTVAAHRVGEGNEAASEGADHRGCLRVLATRRSVVERFVTFGLPGRGAVVERPREVVLVRHRA